MPKLVVEFSGLCAYVLKSNAADAMVVPEVAVFMPDARALGGDLDPSPRHIDGTVGDPHVGYIAMDLANMVNTVAPGDLSDSPNYEVVRRLRRETLQFVLGNSMASIDATKINVPHLNKFAAGYSINANYFKKTPADTELLFRTALNGGTLEGVAIGKQYVVPPSLQATKPGHAARFAGSVTWKRMVPGNVSLLLTDIATNTTETIVLKPVTIFEEEIIAIRISNLCIRNPLEWPEFKRDPVLEDFDFKWLYKLIVPPTGHSYLEDLAGAHLPHPAIDPLGSPEGDEGCYGCCVSQDYTREFPL